MRSTVLALLWLTAGTSAYGTTFTLYPDGSGDFATIQDALLAAFDGDEILLEPGIYSGAGNHDVYFLGNAVTLRSRSGNAERCVIDCQGSAKVPARGFLFIYGEPPGAVLRDLTITGAWTADAGGALTVVGASPTLSGIRFVANGGSGSGSACYLNQIDLALDSCWFQGNGGASVIEVGADWDEWRNYLTLSNCRFGQNPTSVVRFPLGNYGGGNLNVEDCSFIENAVVFEVVLQGPKNTVVTRSHFERNQRLVSLDTGEEDSEKLRFEDCAFDQNGPMHLNGGSITRLESCTFTNGVGGVFDLNDHEVIAENCRFVGNHNDSDGGVAYVVDTGTFHATSCDFVKNSSGARGGVVYDEKDALVRFDSCLFEMNSATKGGAICVGRDEWAGADVRFSTFWRNRAETGGALCLGHGSASVSSCTFAENESPDGAHIFLDMDDASLALERSVLAFGLGTAIVASDESPHPPTVRCTDMYGNTGGDWVDWLAPQLGQNGNVAENPLFCGEATGDLTLRADSPCLAENMEVPCGTMGRFVGPGCPSPRGEITDGRGALGPIRSLGVESASLMSHELTIRPNPTPSAWHISWRIPPGTSVIGDVLIVDAIGRILRCLRPESSHGVLHAEWDGRMASGGVAPTGVYFVRLPDFSAPPASRVLVVRP